MSEPKALIRPDRGEDAIAIHLVNKDGVEAFARGLTAGQRAALEAQKFEGGGYQFAIIPDSDSWFVVSGVANPECLSSWCLAKLAEELPEGNYRLVTGAEGSGPGPAMFGWITGQYRFARYRSEDKAQGPRVLLTTQVALIEAATAEAEAECYLRDLVNMPPEDLGPAALEAECEGLAKAHKAELVVVRGDTLEQDYPMIHAVGRAAARHHAPRLMHLVWGDPAHPVLAVVGKGVCFDSGGLDMKTSAGMRLMKKDMGGAANALGLAQMVMALKLPVRLQLLIPAVENAIAGNAYRPGDVFKTRQGLHIEIGNTDAEGRVILCDALAYGAEGKPDLMIDMATLTGAARVALGAQLPALFSRDTALARQLMDSGLALHDPMWHMPLWDAYHGQIQSDIADIVNTGKGGLAGAVTAALFLQDFVPAAQPWLHLDLFAWNNESRPGRPVGGEAQTLRTLLAYLEARYTQA